MIALYCVNWTESERGWGQRPDGYTLHKDFKTAKEFIDKHWDSMPPTTPDIYSFPSEPFITEASKEECEIALKEGSFWGKGKLRSKFRSV